MTLDELITTDVIDLLDPLQLVHDACYRWGDCEAIRYDPKRIDIFGPHFLPHLYDRCLTSGRAKQGILSVLFCGQRNLSSDAICAYLSTVPVIALGRWRADETFHVLGFTFPAAAPIIADPEHQTSNPNSLFAGYGFFYDAWGTPDQRVLTILGLSFLFHEFRLAAIHGVRYHDNHLTVRWMRQFGFRDIGRLEHYLYHQPSGQLVAGIISTCLRKDFADLLRDLLLGLRGKGSEDGERGREGLVQSGDLGGAG